MLSNTFTWTSVPGAASYEFQLRNLSTGETVLNSTLNSTSWTPGTVLFSGVRYRWWVRAKSAQNVLSAWSPGSDFIAGGQTTVQTPVGATADSTPTFSWLAVAGAVKYQILVHRIDVPTSIINRNDIVTNSFTPTTGLATGTYRVWVRAFSASGTLTTWSVPASFSVTDTDTDTDTNTERPDETTEIPQLLASQINMLAPTREASITQDSSVVAEYAPANDLPAEKAYDHVTDPVETTSLKRADDSTTPEDGVAEVIDLAIAEWIGLSADLT
jgi:hypothetical protein